jgi:hypothetical protein
MWRVQRHFINFNHASRYTAATEICPIRVRVTGSRGFSFFASSCTPIQPPVFYINQPRKHFVDIIIYHMVIAYIKFTTNSLHRVFCMFINPSTCFGLSFREFVSFFTCAAYASTCMVEILHIWLKLLLRIMNYNFVCCFVCGWTLVTYTEGRT